MLLSTTVTTLALSSVAATCFLHPAGVWVAPKPLDSRVKPPEKYSEDLLKVASIGIRVSRGITSHGIAIQISPDLSLFSELGACGLQHTLATSVLEVTGTAPAVGDFAHHWHKQFNTLLEERSS